MEKKRKMLDYLLTTIVCMHVLGKAAPREWSLVLLIREEEEGLLVVGTALHFLLPCPPFNLLCIQFKNCKPKPSKFINLAIYNFRIIAATFILI